MLFRLPVALFVGFAAFVCIAHSVQAFSLAPASIELAGVRGETVEGTMRLINESAAEQTVYLSAVKTASRGDSAAPTFFPYDEDHSGLPEWLGYPSSVVLPANAYTDITFSVAIPSDVASGGYYGALLVSEAPAPIVATNGAVIQANVAELLLLTVEGETHVSAPLLDFVRNGSGFVTNVSGVAYAWRAQNQGNVHVAPTGVVRATDVFGRVIQERDANPDHGRILPGVTRTFSGSFGDSPKGFFDHLSVQVQEMAVGPVEVTLDVVAGDSTLAQTFTVWVFPWQALLVAFLLCLVVFLTFRAVLRKAPPSS